MTEFPNNEERSDENSHNSIIIENRISENNNEFAPDLSTHFIELCDACRSGDLEVVQTFDPFSDSLLIIDSFLTLVWISIKQMVSMPLR